ncbi:cytochrome BD ubiquinol oxidase subunit I [Pseudodesulfovibrio cashew]|uniref:Cytochrome BD ubiquinol oxidase subunit I n=1 Tax=Pseudodesulfovibrio cashew TaxID=2678688 RepID=A0A6I6JFD0_9BACT|nr:cytochrome ubiquinol oxidase subunit I [Pseudodesulfovibrio cashew]QGY39112.1 cytochrome BD ubiquinol oxidase subunit I [Pseudodesulfovibrio cashew]
MEYPIWQLTTLGGGFWIALIATLHVYVAHFAVGGGLLLVLVEQAAYRNNNVHLLDYVKKHSRFFLLLTMAFGAVSGVAIWITIALLAPQATITLIHQFVFGWAAEWVCFLGEIVALIVYYYTWESMDRRDHLTVGWLYFLFGWLSLFLINGIIGFMLTPGDWITTKSFWDGFFNPTFWPQLVFRSFFSAACAGLFGFVTATRIQDEDTRHAMVRTCSVWTTLGIVATILSGLLYMAALPPAQMELITLKSHRVLGFMTWFWIFAGVTLVGGLILAFRMPRTMSFSLAMLVMLSGLGLFGSFEFIREAGRKPYLIWDYTYSNSIQKAMVPVINQEGAIKHAKWAPPELKAGITEANVLKAGEFLYQLECASCHAIGGPMNEIRKRTSMYDENGMDAFLTGMGKLNKYMPPFAGTTQERKALAAYIAVTLNGNKATTAATIPDPEAVEPSPFDPDSAEYALLAWADQGMRFFAQNDKWTLLPPRSVVRAQLVLRDGLPEFVTDGVTIEYAVEDGIEAAAPTGTMQLLGSQNRFEADLALKPYRSGQFEPLPVVTLTAKVDGETVATAKVAVPVSDQMGCRNCHGGDWAEDGSGVSQGTVENILAAHDRMNKTDHVAASAKGPITCANCHADPSQDSEGRDNLPSLAAAIHGVHAVYMAGRDSAQSCMLCHPQNTLRDNHGEAGFECANCHGPLEDHAISLLKGDQEAGRKGANKLLPLITPRNVGNADAVNPRTPWVNEPDCLNCHVDFAAPDSDSTFNEWTDDETELFAARRDEMDAVNCAACHGSPHALYPATDRDNVMPGQYMDQARIFGAAGSCTVCHVDEMEDPAHHAGMGLN